MKSFVKMLSIIAAAQIAAISAQAAKSVDTPNAPGETTVRAKAFDKLPDHPLAPKEFRRPQGYVPTLYKYNLRELSEKYSAETIVAGDKIRRRVADTNARGKWKPEGAAIDAHKCPEWFEDAKFGIFIDWGLWSIASWAPKREGGAMYPDWYEARMYSDFTPKSHFWGYRSYHIKNWGADFERDHFIPLFKAEKYDPYKLAEIFKNCGAKYVVPFAKHHSGFCLWDCPLTKRDAVDMGPRRDLVKPLVEACAANGLKFGLYASLTEWEYPIIGAGGALANFSWGKRTEYSPDMEFKASGKIAVKDYVGQYLIPQIADFIDRYKPDILWFDGEWGVPASELGGYDIAAYFYNVNDGKKEVAVNDRYGVGTPEEIGGKFLKRKRNWLRTVRGDFFTDEFGDTSERIDPSKHHPWEACRGISQSYGNNWQDDESNVVSAKEFVSIFVDIVARGGNLLLLVNLDGQGAIPEIQSRRLADIGEWLAKNGEAVYATRIVAPFATPDVSYTRSKDGKFCYAIVKNPRAETTIKIVPAKGSKIVELSSKRSLPWKPTADGSGATVSLGGFGSAKMPVALRVER